MARSTAETRHPAPSAEAPSQSAECHRFGIHKLAAERLRSVSEPDTERLCGSDKPAEARMHLRDRYLPTYQFSETHACRVRAEAAAILDSVAAYRPESDGFFPFMIGLREWPMRLLGQSDATRPPFGLHDFTLLGRSDSEIVYGLIGQFWRPDYGLEPIADGAEFRAFAASHAAKLALSFTVERDPDGRTRLVTRTRVLCPSRAARLKFTPYWLAIRPISGLLRRRVLASIKQDCERPRGRRSGEPAIAGGNP